MFSHGERKSRLAHQGFLHSLDHHDGRKKWLDCGVRVQDKVNLDEEDFETMDSQMKQEGYPPPYPTGTDPGPVPQAAPAQITVNQPPATVCIQSTIFGEYPAAMVCTHCHSSIQTRIAHQAGMLTWIVAGIICLFGLFCGCCLIPFCLDICLDVVHSCPSCGHVLGVYQRLH